MVIPSSKLIFAVLISTGSLASSQSPTAEPRSMLAPPVQQDKQGKPQGAQPSQGPIDWHQLQVDRFWGFSIEILNEEGKAKRDEKVVGPAGGDMVNYAKILHFTESEERVMRLIMLDAAARQAKNESRWSPDDAWAHMSRSERSAVVDLVEHERLNIFENAIARLKQQLGEDDFKRLDDYLSRGDARTIDAKRRSASGNVSGAHDDVVPK